MRNIKYQIFISSTYEDLKKERDQVIKACLEMGHIPVGMEMFSAADEEQWQIIARQIEASDYYVVIVANKYGSMVDGVSYTEKEYDYAILKGVPVLGFVLKDGAMWHSEHSESNPKVRQRLDAFKQKIKNKPVSFWKSKEELHGQCAIALMKAFNTNPRQGWLPASEVDSPQITAELSRLSSENAKLREELEQTKAASDTSIFAQGSDPYTLHFAVSGLTHTIPIETTWRELFMIANMCMRTEPYVRELWSLIPRVFKDQVIAIFKAEFPDQILLDETVYFPLLDKINETESSPSKDQFDEIEAQFIALGLIKLDYDGYGKSIWRLTSAGEQEYARAFARRRPMGN